MDLVRHVWRYGSLSLESNHARGHRIEVAFAASMGWISILHPDGQSYDPAWHVTAAGLFLLKEN